jgi:hypothetical protein
LLLIEADVTEEVIEMFEALRPPKLLLCVPITEGECSMITLDVGAIAGLVD